MIDVIEKESGTTDPPLNLISLANYLVDRRIVPKENFLVMNTAFDNVKDEVLNFKPDIIGFSVLTPFYDLAKRLATELKALTGATILIGSYHISALPEQLEEPYDVGVVGEGELTLIELVGLWQKGEIRNFRKLSKVLGICYFNEKGKVIITDPRPLIDVASLPMVDWSIIPEKKMLKYMVVPINGRAEARKFTSMYTARGCPYNCAFCAHRVLTGGKSGVRNFPIERVLNEMEYLYREYKVTCIQVLDDTFAVSKTRTRELIEGLRTRNLLGKICFYMVFIRANIIDQEYSNLLKELGVTTVFIGIESGSVKVLKAIKDGPMSADMVKKAVKCFGNNQIFITGSFMLFSPNEGQKDFSETINLVKWFIKQKNAFAVIFSITTPYPGTRLWIDAVKSGLVNSFKWDEFRMFYLMRAGKMPRVFYRPDWADDKKMYKLWLLYGKFAEAARKNVQAIPGWRREENISQVLYEKLVKSWVTRVHEGEMAGRIRRMVSNPGRSVGRLLKNPQIIIYVLKDIKKILF